MPEDVVSLISAYLWDLRAQCEEQLRSLTKAQRRIEEYRVATTALSLAEAKGRLQEALADVTRTNAEIRESVKDTVKHVDELPTTPPTALRRRVGDKSDRR
jgi:hypothetical protein